MVQSSHENNRKLQNVVHLSYDLNQQTYVVFGQAQAKQEDLPITAEVNGSDDKGQGCVNDTQGNTENPNEASADVLPL